MKNILRTFWVLLLLYGIVAAFGARAAEINKSGESSSDTIAQFAKSIDDLPLMQGLKPLDENDVLFVTKSGRIAQATATGMVDVDSVYDFYKRSLPQLGWDVVDARTYERGKERLSIDVSGVNPKAMTIVRFSVQPIE